MRKLDRSTFFRSLKLSTGQGFKLGNLKLSNSFVLETKPLKRKWNFAKRKKSLFDPHSFLEASESFFFDTFEDQKYLLIKNKRFFQDRQKSWPRSFLSAGGVFCCLKVSTQRNFGLLYNPKNDWIPEASPGLSHFLNVLKSIPKPKIPQGRDHRKIPVQFELLSSLNDLLLNLEEIISQASSLK